MNRKTEVTIFFSALIMFGVALAGGIAYFKTPAKPDGQLADLTALGQPQNEAVQIIPTSTITTTASGAPSPGYQLLAVLFIKNYTPSSIAMELRIKNLLAII